ncbi:hypothetical protein Hanom_Chr17g01590451 [Helianthus anomalus]
MGAMVKKLLLSWYDRLFFLMILKLFILFIIQHLQVKVQVRNSHCVAWVASFFCVSMPYACSWWRIYFQNGMLIFL